MGDFLSHHGVAGMHWGSRRATSQVETSGKANRVKPVVRSKAKPQAKDRTKAVRVGASVVAGLLASNLGGLAIANLSGSLNAASIAAPVLGVIGGMAYYDFISN